MSTRQIKIVYLSVMKKHEKKPAQSREIRCMFTTENLWGIPPQKPCVVMDGIEKLHKTEVSEDFSID